MTTEEQGRALADKVAELSDVQGRKKTAAAEFRAQEKKIKAEIQRLASEVRTGQATLYAGEQADGGDRREGDAIEQEGDAK